MLQENPPQLGGSEKRTKGEVDNLLLHTTDNIGFKKLTKALESQDKE